MWFLITGILFGTIAGMGMGGGIILIPVLTVFLGVDQQGAQGLNLLCFLPMAGFALFSHIKNKRVDFSWAIALGIGGLAGSLLGAYLAGLMKNEVLGKIFGGLLILLGGWRAFGQISQMIKKKKGKSREAQNSKTGD